MKRKKINSCLLSLFLSLFFWIVLAHPSSGIAVQPDWNFFKGKVITYIVPTKPGGGYDSYARLIGRFMQKHIPGSTIIVKNVLGAGQLIGTHELYNSKPNGLTIGTFQFGLTYSQIVGQPGLKFDLKKFTWIGKAASDSRVLIIGTKRPYKTFQDLKKAKEIYIGTSGAGDAAQYETVMLADALGLNLTPTPGYEGNEAELAMMRGEIDGHICSWLSIKHFVERGDGRVILQFRGKRHPELPDVPLGSSEVIGPKGKAVVDFIEGIYETHRVTAGPPDIPEGRTMVLIEAYKKALTDPELLKQAEKWGLSIAPLYGEKVAQLVTDTLNPPKEIVEMLKKVFKVVK